MKTMDGRGADPATDCDGEPEAVDPRRNIRLLRPPLPLWLRLRRPRLRRPADDRDFRSARGEWERVKRRLALTRAVKLILSRAVLGSRSGPSSDDRGAFPKPKPPLLFDELPVLRRRLVGGPVSPSCTLPLSVCHNNVDSYTWDVKSELYELRVTANSGSGRAESYTFDVKLER